MSKTRSRKIAPLAPATTIIEKFGGYARVAELLNCDVSRVYRWTYPVENGGTGGTVPAKQQAPLLEAAKRTGVNLTPADFFASASEEAA